MDMKNILVSNIVNIDPGFCPRCESDLTIPNIYQNHFEDKKALKQLIKTGKARLASASRSNRMTYFHCNCCGYNFAPINPKFDIKNISHLLFTYQDSLNHNLSIKCILCMHAIHCEICSHGKQISENDISNESWQHFLNILLHKAHLYNWYERYYSEKKDATSLNWQISLLTNVSDSKHPTWSGINVLPPYWFLFIDSLTQCLIKDEKIAMNIQDITKLQSQIQIYG